MSDPKLKIAVFIDFDNVEIGVKTTLGLQFDIGAVLEAIKERGEIVTKCAYGDWKRSGDYGRAMSNHAVRLVQRVMTPGGDKNGADINLALDALEMAFTHAHINAFVIVGGDSDFITLVEKLKQYDRKVFVVGGRAFTSQVMQKNCTEFIAYENVVPDRRPIPRQERGERPRSAGGTQNIDAAVALVKRALKVLADREVTPQLGLLKSTLLQLDSSFSERDYGSSSFRDFADKLAQHGIVTLKHQGRSTLVELVEGADESLAPMEPMPVPIEELMEAEPAAVADTPIAAPIATPVDGGQSPAARVHDDDGRRGVADAASLGEGVSLVRRVMAEATTAPRWPMYPRQFKQFLRAAEASFDERKYGSIAELMRACQKDGLLKLERDRQGGLRVFAAAGGTPRVAVPHGWSILAGGQPLAGGVAETGEGPELHDEQPPMPPVRDDILDDDIGNRISGGAVDVTRETVGGRGFGRSAAPAVAPDHGMPDHGMPDPEMPDPEMPDAEDEQPPAPPRPRRARKTAAKRAPAAAEPRGRQAAAAKRPAARRKKE